MSYFKRGEECSLCHVGSLCCLDVEHVNMWRGLQSLRHIFITNTLLKETPWIGPCLSLLSLLDLYNISAQDGHYKSRFKSAGKIWLCQLGVKPAQKLPYKMTY